MHKTEKTETTKLSRDAWQKQVDELTKKHIGDPTKDENEPPKELLDKLYDRGLTPEQVLGAEEFMALLAGQPVKDPLPEAETEADIELVDTIAA